MNDTAIDSKEARQMVFRMARWDELSHEQKQREFFGSRLHGYHSPFRDVPGFEPVLCRDCDAGVHPDFREAPEGLCPINPDHDLESHDNISDMAAA